MIAKPTPTVSSSAWSRIAVILVVHTGAMLSTDASAMLCRLLISMIQGHIGRVYGFRPGKAQNPSRHPYRRSSAGALRRVRIAYRNGGSANVLTTLYIQDIAQLRIATNQTTAPKSSPTPATPKYSCDVRTLKPLSSLSTTSYETGVNRHLWG